MSEPGLSLMTSAFDYVIIGGGPAGCVLAHRLSENPAARVLLLEAGGGHASLFLRLLARFGWLDPGLRWKYETVPQHALDDRRLYLPQGRVLGGGSAINAMTYVRGHPSDYDGWHALGNDGWDSRAVLAAFKRLENNHAHRNEFHGQGGPLDVSDQIQPHPLTRAFVEAGNEIGLPLNPDFNGSSQDGVGTYQVTQRNGRRWSAATAFLDPARRRPNLTVLTRAQALRIRLERDRATAVEYLRAGRVETAHASAEVIVSAGAINSPKLLLLSGIGSADALRPLGIPVVHDLPGTGQNLHDHLNVQVISRSRRPITYDGWDRPVRFVRYGLQYLLFNTGVATSNICEGGGFLHSSPRVASPDIQLHFMPLIWLDHGRSPVRGSGMTLEAAFLRPASRGSVSLASADPTAAPRIDPRYCTAPGDLEPLVEAIRHCRAIMRARAFGPLVAGELYPGPEMDSDAELTAYVRRHAITSYHPVGTCRMGIDDFAVVDPRLRVRGVQSLRVVDSSIMPRIVSGSTQAAAMMIGEIGASMVHAAQG